MPLYEFKCPKCLEISEFHLKLSEAYPTDCPQCGTSGLQKIISQTSFKLAGGGWYDQGYDGKSNQQQPSSQGGNKAKDSNPATATSAKTEQSAASTQASEKSATKK